MTERNQSPNARKGTDLGGGGEGGGGRPRDNSRNVIHTIEDMMSGKQLDSKCTAKKSICNMAEF